MEGLQPRTRDDRARLVDQLVDMHRRQLGDNLLGLATQGSYARKADGEYSDVELVAFLRTVPGTTSWADCVQIWQGTLIDIIWTTKDDYIARVKEVTPQWHLAGSDHLGALINAPLIDEINGYEPPDLRRKCREQLRLHWPVTQESTGKVLNAIGRGNSENLGLLVFALLDSVLVDLAFLNERPYTSVSTSLSEAQGLPKLPRGFDEVVALAVDGGYTDAARTRVAVRTVFAGLEELLTAEGIALYERELSLLPRSSP